MGHCQKSQNSTHLENQILQWVPECQTCLSPCSAHSHSTSCSRRCQAPTTQGWWGEVVTPPRSRGRRGALPWDPGVRQLQVSAGRTTWWELLQESQHTVGGLLTQSLLPKAIRASLQMLILVSNRSGQHSRKWLRHWALQAWDLNAQHWAGPRSERHESQYTRECQARANTWNPASPRQTEGSSVKPQSRLAAESYHQRRCRWGCDSREGDTWLPRLRQQISWESELASRSYCRKA